MNKAVFLDRDGVINPLVYNIATCEYESPHYPKDFSVFPNVIRALRKLISQGYHLFVVSNQPSYAKGKTTLENIQAIEGLLKVYFNENGLQIQKYYYCYHHPEGVVAEYSGQCKCRKPGTLFLEDAFSEYNLSAESCWFVGDRDLDIKCGKAMGMQTVLINNEHSAKNADRETPDAHASDIYDAVTKILERE